RAPDRGRRGGSVPGLGQEFLHQRYRTVRGRRRRPGLMPRRNSMPPDRNPSLAAISVQVQRRPGPGMMHPTAARPSRVKEDNGMSERSGSEVGWNRRKFLAAASTGIVGSTVAGNASADTLADVPHREPGSDLGAFSARSKYVQIGRIPEAGP